MNPTQFEIQDLRNKNQQTFLELIGLVLFAVFFGAFAPSIIINLFYSKTQLLEAPWFYQTIPVVALAISMLYTLYAFTSSVLREIKIKNLRSQLITGDDLTSDLEEKEIKELESLVEKTLKTKKKPTNKKRTRRSAK